MASELLGDMMSLLEFDSWLLKTQQVDTFHVIKRCLTVAAHPHCHSRSCVGTVGGHSEAQLD